MEPFREEEEKKFSIWLKVFVAFVVALSAKPENQLSMVFAMPTVIAELKKGVSGDFG
jgi:hypothetical protein